MALVKCPLCGENISDKAATCPHCGYVVRVIEEQAIQHNPKRRSRNWGELYWGELFLIVVVALTAFFAWNTIKQNENKNAEYKERIYQKSGIKFRGDYSNAELKGIAEGGKLYIERHNDLQNKIFDQEGLSITDIPPF